MHNLSCVQTAKHSANSVKTTMSTAGAELAFPIACKTDDCIIVKSSLVTPEAAVTCKTEVKQHVILQSTNLICVCNVKSVAGHQHIDRHEGRQSILYHRSENII